MKANVYEIVTNRIIENLNNGVIPWHRPWAGAKVSPENSAISYVTRRAYSVINQWLLGEPGEYLTYKQVQQAGGKVKAGAKSKIVVFFEKVNYTKKNEETGEDEVFYYPLLKYYNVFHIQDTEGVKSKNKPGEVVEIETDKNADAVIADYVGRTGLKFQNDKPSSKAYYSPSIDAVVVPMVSQYSNIAEYYSTTFHELTHSTMKANRCNREAENKNSFFGNHDYSREELVAEIGAAMICTRLGISTEKAFTNSVAYI